MIGWQFSRKEKPYGRSRNRRAVLAAQRTGHQRNRRKIWGLLHENIAEYSARAGGQRRKRQRYLFAGMEGHAASPSKILNRLFGKVDPKPCAEQI